jgi:molybdopterin/thiamine biosynthesis adenylyltransferase
LQKQLDINDWSHQNGVHFIAAGTHGLFGYVNSIFILILTHPYSSVAQVMRLMISAPNFRALIQPANSLYLE